MFRSTIKVALLCIVASLSASGQASSGPSDLEKERKDYGEALVPIKQRVLAGLSPTESSLAKMIDISVVYGQGDIQLCRALPAIDGRYSIEMSQEFLRSLWMFSMATVIGEERKDPAQAYKYVDYVIAGLHENISARGAKVTKKVESPELAMHLLPSERTLVLERTSSRWSSNLVFILSHEYAHHFLGHTSRPAPATQEEKLRMEEAADSWAIHHLLQLGIPPAAGAVSLAYFGALFSEIGPISEHPAGACRARALVVSTLNNIGPLTSSLKAAGLDPSAIQLNEQRVLVGMDSGADGCPTESDPAVSNLREMLRPLLSGGAKQDLCKLRGNLVARDETGRSYETVYMADGWKVTLEFPRGESGCVLSAERTSGDMSAEYDKVVSLVEKYSEDCEDRDSSFAAEATYCQRSGVHIRRYDKRRERLLVEVDSR